jgi:N-methylhydantoinase B
MFILNDPYRGGVTHLNDHLLLLPIFHDHQIVAWSCNIAHWGDIGGHVPGSLDINATELFHEGIVLPGVKLFIKG